MTRRPRDSQQPRVYAAEREAYGTTLHQGTMSHQAVVDLVRDLTEEIDGPVVHARHRRSGNRSRGGRLKDGTPYIGLTPHDRNPMMVCHELAHALVEDAEPRTHAWHGPQWCRVYLMLLELACGSNLVRVLEAAFDRNRVDHSSGLVEVAA